MMERREEVSAEADGKWAKLVNFCNRYSRARFIISFFFFFIRRNTRTSAKSRDISGYTSNLPTPVMHAHLRRSTMLRRFSAAKLFLRILVWQVAHATFVRSNSGRFRGCSAREFRDSLAFIEACLPPRTCAIARRTLTPEWLAIGE